MIFFVLSLSLFHLSELKLFTAPHTYDLLGEFFMNLKVSLVFVISLGLEGVVCDLLCNLIVKLLDK